MLQHMYIYDPFSKAKILIQVSCDSDDVCAGCTNSLLVGSTTIRNKFAVFMYLTCCMKNLIILCRVHPISWILIINYIHDEFVVFMHENLICVHLLSWINIHYSLLTIFMMHCYWISWVFIVYVRHIMCWHELIKNLNCD